MHVLINSKVLQPSVSSCAPPSLSASLRWQSPAHGCLTEHQMAEENEKRTKKSVLLLGAF